MAKTPGKQDTRASISLAGDIKNASLWSDYDITLFKAGMHYRLYEKMGAHIMSVNGQTGTYYSVWAPNASYVSVIGAFNEWNRHSHSMYARWDASGIWELFIPGIGTGEYYKYYIENPNGYHVEKGDPYAYYWEKPPATASIVKDIDYEWTDNEWLRQRQERSWEKQALSIYEVHIGSWKRNAEQNRGYLTYRELALQLPAYCKEMGFTHVEFMPVMEHPFYGSWGYQITGFYAPSSRYGDPRDFMHLIDTLHAAGIGVILDWVPSHFPDDEHGLAYFDGTHLYEHADPRRGKHPDWNSNIFNFNRNEVKAFLISNALYWLDKFHIDGLRVDAVASMLYLNYSRKDGEWIPNEYGGRENIDAINFLRAFNEAVHTWHPHVMTIAEESSAWPAVTHPTGAGGLGFDLTWMMGWMHDTLQYFSYDPVYRSHHQGSLTFNIFYAFFEKFIMPLSHDEVVYGKRSLLLKMPGDEWQKFANLRLLLCYMFGCPGGKLLFMGAEFAQRNEWAHDFSLDWHESEQPLNQGVQRLVTDLNGLYSADPRLHENDYSGTGYEWVDFNDTSNSVIAWMRKSDDGRELIFVCNFTPVVRYNYRLGMPHQGYYREVLNTDDTKYGGSNVKNDDEMETAPMARHGRQHSLALILPPLAALILEWKGYSVDFSI